MTEVVSPSTVVVVGVGTGDVAGVVIDDVVVEKMAEMVVAARVTEAEKAAIAIVRSWSEEEEKEMKLRRDGRVE